MFALQAQENPTKPRTLTPHILPCRIHHDGPADVSSRYWNPVADEKDADISTAYFRGRKLRGRNVRLPDGYHGVVATQSDKKLDISKKDDRNGSLKESEMQRKEEQGEDEEDDDEEEEPTPVSVLEARGTFENLVVWDHEKVPALDDTFVKGVDEWIRFSNAIHSDEDVHAIDGGRRDEAKGDAVPVR